MSTQFCLPRTLDILNHESTKASWKQSVDEHLNAYWVSKIKLQERDKSSLRVLNTEKYEIGEVLYIVSGKMQVSNKPMVIKKAGIKARLMTGTYVPQPVRAKFNQYSVDPTCLPRKRYK